MKIHYIDPTVDERWDRFIAEQKNSSIFHTSAWARVIKDTYGYEPRYYVLEDDAGRIRTAIPFYFIRSPLTGKRLVSLPFSDYCWPLGEDDANTAQLLESVKKEVETGAASYLELRGWKNGIAPSEHNLTTREYHVTYMLDLTPGLEKLNKTFHDSVRRGIRQAEKRGITVSATKSEEGIDKFYYLNVITRKKLGVLPQPQAFFKNIYRYIISNNLGFTVLAENEGKTIAGVVFLTYNDTIYYKFNASDKRYLQKRPNHLITWEGIRYAHENNFKQLDFGRCAPEEEGLKIYKSRWGAKEVNLPYYYYPGIKGVTSIPEGSLHYQIMRIFSFIMPRFAFKAAGSRLYKHFG